VGEQKDEQLDVDDAAPVVGGEVVDATGSAHGPIIEGGQLAVKCLAAGIGLDRRSVLDLWVMTFLTL
jgi:hypothetical protein